MVMAVSNHHCHQFGQSTPSVILIHHHPMFRVLCSMIARQVRICKITQTVLSIATLSALLLSSYALLPIALHQYSHIMLLLSLQPHRHLPCKQVHVHLMSYPLSQTPAAMTSLHFLASLSRTLCKFLHQCPDKVLADMYAH